MSAGKWRELLKTAQFTTPNYIASAVACGLQYSSHHGKKTHGHISTAEAREVMAFLENPEPANWRDVIREHFSEPHLVKQEKGPESYPINHDVKDHNAVAWGMILGIERAWFAHDRSGFVGWTKAGRNHFPDMRREERPPAPKPKPCRSTGASQYTAVEGFPVDIQAMISRRYSEVLPEIGSEMGHIRIPASPSYVPNAPVVFPEQCFGSRHS